MFSHSKFSSGFSLMEMIVVIAIFTIMTGIVLANLPEFRDRTNLELVSQQIAINIRSAQVFGVGTRASASGSFDTWYGIHFDPDANQQVILFADENRNGLFEGDPNDPANPGEYIHSAKLPANGKYKIMRGCASTNGDERCQKVGSTLDGPVNIIYRRPSTEARFCFERDGACAVNGVDNVWDNSTSNLILEISSSRDDAKIAKGVSVWSNGQINVVPGFFDIE